MPIQSVPFFSSALFARKTCMVYTPASYETSDRRYPVVYLLHGLYGGETDWTLKGSAETTLDRMINDGRLRECIVVMPNDGEYGHGTFYCDWYDGTGNFEEYFIHDLVPFIDEAFRTLTDRSSRVIAGLSMGGFGSILLTLRNSNLFGAAASLSGFLAAVTEGASKDYWRSDFSRMFGPQKGEYAQEHDIHILSSMRMADNDRPELYFDCGKKDYLLPFNLAFDKHLNKIGYRHEHQLFEGDHTWEYWTEHLVDALSFLERYFKKSMA